MKKILLLCFVIVFVAGCIGEEKATDTETSVDSQTTQETPGEVSGLIFKQSDLPSGFQFHDGYVQKLMAQKNGVCNINISGCNLSFILNNEIPADARYFGEDLFYQDSQGKQITIQISIFDSNEGFKEEFEKLELHAKNNINIEKSGRSFIGEYSFWEEYKDTNPITQESSLTFSIKNTYVSIKVLDDKINGHDLALKVAKSLADKLD